MARSSNACPSFNSVDQIRLVPNLDDSGRLVIRIAIACTAAVARNAQLTENGENILALRIGIGMSDIAHVQYKIRCANFLKRRPESRDKLRWQIGHETHSVREDDLVDARQLNLAHRRVQRRKQHVLRHDVQHPSDD